MSVSIYSTEYTHYIFLQHRLQPLYVHIIVSFQEFSLQDYNDIVGGWKDKIKRTAAGDQRWGVFYAEKPANWDLIWPFLSANILESVRSVLP